MTISLFRGYRVFFCRICDLAFQFGHLDGRLIDEADDQQGDDANDPFEVDDVRQQADSRHNCQRMRPAMPARVVQKAVFLRHRDGAKRVHRKTRVKAVVRLRPMSMTFTMPTA